MPIAARERSNLGYRRKCKALVEQAQGDGETYDKASLLDILREFGILRQEPVTFRTVSFMTFA